MKLKRRIFLVLLDSILVNLSFIVALYIRFDNLSTGPYLETYSRYIIAVTLIKLIIYYAFDLYQSLWEYASISELIDVVTATLLANLIVIIFFILLKINMPRSVYIIVAIMDIIFVGGLRFAYRVLRRLRHKRRKGKEDTRVLIIGAGDAGAMVLKELRNYSDRRFTPVAFIDDDLEKYDRVINGIRVVGDRSDIVEICAIKDIDEIIIALPSASLKERQAIVNVCILTKCRVKTLPGIYDLIDGKVTFNQIREVEISDLLGRDEIELNCRELASFIADQVILVTGGGGSIGSELCRQLIVFKPRQLIILDCYENSAYDLQVELLQKHPDLNLVVLIGSVRDKARIGQVMSDYQPQVVFHAAAHKHVPLMEDSPKDAVKNNVFGTLNLAAAHQHGVVKFIQISTDKAVNPTNVMGATKRICEKIILAYNSISQTDFVAVRFGNVLGSNGSVIPLFKKQIAAGGPVTVTDKNIIRYFMTIPEASQLVLQAGAIAKGGEIFILDMGEPVKIEKLAMQLIKLSGYEPHVDIAIDYIGLRPGEKLYEELLLNRDQVAQTSHQKIFIEPVEAVDYQKLMGELKQLGENLDQASNFMVKEELKGMDLNYNVEKTIYY